MPHSTTERDPTPPSDRSLCDDITTGDWQNVASEYAHETLDTISTKLDLYRAAMEGVEEPRERVEAYAAILKALSDMLDAEVQSLKYLTIFSSIQWRDDAVLKYVFLAVIGIRSVAPIDMYQCILRSASWRRSGEREGSVGGDGDERRSVSAHDCCFL